MGQNQDKLNERLMEMYFSKSKKIRITLLIAIPLFVAAVSVSIVLLLTNSQPENQVSLFRAEGSSFCEVAIKTQWLRIHVASEGTPSDIAARFENEKLLNNLLEEFNSDFTDQNISHPAHELYDGFYKLTIATTQTDIMSAISQADFAMRQLNTACTKAGYPSVELFSLAEGVNNSVTMAIPTNTLPPDTSGNSQRDPNKFQPLNGSLVGATRTKVGQCDKSENICLDVEVSSPKACPGGIYADVLFKGIHSNAPVESKSTITESSKAGEEFQLHFESSTQKVGSAELVDLVCIGADS